MKFSHPLLFLSILATFLLLGNRLSPAFPSALEELYFEEAWREENQSCIVLNRIANVATDHSNFTTNALCTNATRVLASHGDLFVNFSFLELEDCVVTDLTLDVPPKVGAKERFYANVKINASSCGVKTLKLVAGASEVKQRVFLGPNLTLQTPLSFDRAGTYELRVEFDGRRISREVLVENSRFSFLIPFALLSLLLLLYTSLRGDLAGSLLRFFTLLLGSFTLIPTLLGSVDVGIAIPTVLLTFFLCIFYFAFRSRESSIEFQSQDARTILLGFVLLTFFTLLPKLIFPSQDTLWNVFYERIARETFYRDEIPSFDSLSYLGRPMTYPRGYFALKASLLRAFDLDFDLTSTLLLELLFNFALFLALITFFAEMGLNRGRALLATLLFCSTIFVYTLLSAHLLHVPSLALLFASLVWVRRREKFLSLIAISASTLIHPFSLLLFLFFALWLREVFIGLYLASISLLLFLVFHANVLSMQTPRVVAPTEWGWLLKGELSGLFVELGFLFLPAFYLALRNLLVNGRRKESLLFLVLSSLYAFVSFRVNLLLALLASFLLVSEASIGRKFLFALAIANFLFSILLLPNNLGGYVRPELISATSYLGSLSLDLVASHPLYGHYLAYSAGKKVLADLYVEYANPVLYDVALRFADSGMLEELSPYGIRLGLLSRHECVDSAQLYANPNFVVCLAVS